MASICNQRAEIKSNLKELQKSAKKYEFLPYI